MMWTATDWFVFGGIVFAFAALMVMAAYLIYANNTLRLKVTRLEDDARAKLELIKQQREEIDRQREYIEKRDKEFRIPNHEFTQVIGKVDPSINDEAGLLITGAFDVTEVGRHHKKDA